MLDRDANDNRNKGAIPSLKSYFDELAVLLEAWWGVMATLTTIYSAVRFNNVRDGYLAALGNLSYIGPFGEEEAYKLNPASQDLLATSLAVLELEGVDIATFYFVTAVFLAFLYSVYRALSACLKKKENDADIDVDIESQSTVKLSTENHKKGMLFNIADASQRIKKYSNFFTIIGFFVGVGLVLEKHKTLLKPVLGKDCQKNPFWALITDSCSNSDLLKLLSLMSYLWLGMAAFWFSSFALMMVAYVVIKGLGNISKKVRIFQEKINAFDQRWESKDKPLNSYRDAIYYFLLILSAIPLPFFIKSALSVANQFSKSNYCGNIGEILKHIFTAHYDDNGENTVCDSSDMALSLSAFLGLFEIGKMWWLFIAIMLIRFVVGGILDGCYPRKQSAENNALPAPIRVAQLIQEKINKLKPWVGGGVVITGATAFPIAMSLANHILKNGWWEWVKFFGVITQVQLAPACERDILALLLNSMLGLGYDGCHPVLVGRAFSAFVSVYWLCTTLGIGAGAVGGFFLPPLLKGLVEKIKSTCCQSASDETKESLLGSPPLQLRKN